MPDEGREALFAPGRTRVKICGVTNAADARMAVEAGADAIGFNLFRGSRRFVELDLAAALAGETPVTRVAVVVNPSEADLDAIVAASCFDAVQFHGDESPEFCRGRFPRWMRAVRVCGPSALAGALAFDTPWLLLDAFSAAGYGGTGTAIDLSLAADFCRAHPDRRLLLAGGLTPETVAGAVRAVKPHGVDVASGVETDGDPRRKDPAKVRAFIEAARGGLGT